MDDQFPCICGHIASDHGITPRETYGDDQFGCESCDYGWNEESCDHCDCNDFREMDNLQYIEWLKEQQKLGGSNGNV